MEKKLTREETIELLIEEGFTPEEAERAVTEAKKDNAEYEYCSDLEQVGLSAFRGKCRRGDYIISAYYTFDADDVRNTDWEFLPWGDPDWYTIYEV